MKKGETYKFYFETNTEHSNYATWSVVAQGDKGGKNKLILTHIEPAMESDTWPSLDFDKLGKGWKDEFHFD